MDNIEHIHQLLTAAEAFYASGDMKSAFENYREAALKGSSEAAYRLGVFYEKGNHVKRDFKAAMQWYYTAAKKGSEDAKNRLSKGLPKPEVKPEEESTESTTIVAQNNETVQESKPAPKPIAATKPITLKKDFSDVDIQFCIAGCVRIREGFSNIASYGYYTSDDICEMDSWILSEARIFRLQHKDNYISYSLRDNCILPIDSSRGASFTFNIRIKRGLQLANQISPYTVLMDMYTTFINKYMTQTSDGRRTPNISIDETNKICDNIKAVLSKYSFIHSYKRVVVMNHKGKTCTLCLSTYKLKEFFLDTNYHQFARYSSIEIGSACETSIELRILEIPRRNLIKFNASQTSEGRQKTKASKSITIPFPNRNKIRPRKDTFSIDFTSSIIDNMQKSKTNSWKRTAIGFVIVFVIIAVVVFLKDGCRKTENKDNHPTLQTEIDPTTKDTIAHQPKKQESKTVYDGWVEFVNDDYFTVENHSGEKNNFTNPHNKELLKGMPITVKTDSSQNIKEIIIFEDFKKLIGKWHSINSEDAIEFMKSGDCIFRINGKTAKDTWRLTRYKEIELRWHNPFFKGHDLFIIELNDNVLAFETRDSVWRFTRTKNNKTP